MKRSIGMIILATAAVLALPAMAQETLPTGARWLEHLNRELLPFWTTEAAYGKPIGAFPSARCNDGTLYNAAKPCPEIRGQEGKRYLIALSRQSFGYGVAFHMSGNRTYLDAMKAGIDFIRNNAMDRVNGGMATTEIISSASWGPLPSQRNVQELAQGLLGMAFYYYLTRDTDVLKDIVAVKNFIFKTYGDTSGALQWQPTANASEKRLIAQLDQLKLYLVLLTPILSQPMKSEWEQDLLRITKVMIDEFYSSPEKLFNLTANRSLLPDQMLKKTGTDFGQNAKAFSMIRRVGLITGQQDLVSFTKDNAPSLFKRAYIASCGCWAEGLRADGSMDSKTAWWVYAELDQLAGTLALHDRTLANYLSQTYSYWFEHFVDKVHRGVWASVDRSSGQPMRQQPKVWQWKNAYHSFEHALVGYVVARQFHAHPVTLYYAFSSDGLPDSVQPYFFSGTIKAFETEKDGQGRRLQKVTFVDVY